MSRDPLLYLGDIVAACRKIERLAAAVNDDELVADETLRYAMSSSSTSWSSGRPPRELHPRSM